ncbi:MAG TPA: hypothetical protein ENG66_04460 [Thermococcus sp.]|nr:hypothetical protein [Thermococcus sp.]
MEGEINLDQLCAEYGYRFAKKVSEADGFDAKKAEVIITKALGVLQEQGLYAFALFCKSRSSGERAGAEEIEALAKELLKELSLINDGDFLEELQKDDGLLTKLDYLMLAIQVLEKSLIYARFHAKAMKEAGEE